MKDKGIKGLGGLQIGSISYIGNVYGLYSTVRSLAWLHATPTSRLQAETAWPTYKRDHGFSDASQLSLYKSNERNLTIL